VKKSGADIVYYRFDGRLPNIIGLFLSGKKIVIEHNTIEIMELNKKKNKREYFIEKYSGFIFRQLSHGIVGVTDQILKYELSRAITKKPGLVLANSINTSIYPSFKTQFTYSKKMAFVGHFNYWHGLDRMVDLLNDPLIKEFKLLVVGELAKTIGKYGDQGHLERLIADRRIVFTGPLFGKELENTLKECDIGIGSLASFRKGLEEACPLKVRLYLALGLPVMIGYDDPDLPERLPFVFRVKNSDERIAAEGFIKFYNRISTTPGIILSARKYAEEHMDTKVKMKSLAAFFEMVLKK
jgi:glycosyltransferase involved in cell wall biosynthesis